MVTKQTHYASDVAYGPIASSSPSLLPLEPQTAAHIVPTTTNPFQSQACEPLNIPSTQDSTSQGHRRETSVDRPLSNPFRTPGHTPRVSQVSCRGLLYSPISPIEEDNEPGLIMAAEQRKSVDFRKLDGSQYLDDNGTSSTKPHKVKVANDMYAGEIPPGYETRSKPDAAKDCHSCGKHKRNSSSIGSLDNVLKNGGPKDKSKPHGDCGQCGGRKSMPPSSFPGASRVPEAGSSSVRPGVRSSCTKCGRRKKPDSAQAKSNALPQLQTNGLSMIGINVEPPTAVSEKAPTLSFSPASGRTPLIRPTPTQAIEKNERPKASRTNSLSSLFRSLSRRKHSREIESPLPSQQLTSNGDADPNQLIDKISSAIRDNSRNQHSHLLAERPSPRPASPFSFVVQPKEEQTFEMNDMRQSKLLERRDSWDKADENTKFLATERPRYSRSQSTQTGIKPPPPQDDVFLALPADQRPGMTRFKSLRSGVSRVGGGLSRSASQISRSTSLRRLESVKRVPEFWYRTDMSLDGAGGEYQYAY